MKKLWAVAAAVVALSGQAFAEEHPHHDLGKKIYERALGRGCGTCHDIDSNPQLKKLIADGKLDRKTFGDVLKNGKGDGKMPKVLDAIMALEPVKKAGMSEEQAVDALYGYLKGSK
jgi:cytochrome c551